ncbi:MAG: helix-turn-helix domain-containing protein [Solirubrobacteraceae bacterium]
MSRAASRSVSPVGTSVSEHIARSLEDPEFRAEYERLAPFEALARIVIMRRDGLGLTQAGLASRMGTTASVISRIESGQHATSARTLKRLAEALDAQAVLGFRFGSGAKPQHELVVL